MENYQPRHAVNHLLTPKTRAWLYRIATATIPLLIAYGALSESTAPLWIALAGAILSTGTAAAYTPLETRKWTK